MEHSGEKTSDTVAYSQRLIDHYQKTWGPATQQVRLQEGRIHDLPADFRVLVFNPHPAEEVYATCSMSQPGDEARLELHWLVSKNPQKKHDTVMLLHAIAHFHRTGASLGWGHSVNFGQPWQPGSGCTHGFISLPYLTGPSLEWMDEPEVRFLWLIPVTQAEVEFKEKEGIEALEKRFESTQFNYLDPLRPSVA